MAKRKLKQHIIEYGWCKGCGICVRFCPRQVLALDDRDKVNVVRAEDCLCCHMCEMRCPDLCIAIEEEGSEEAV